MTLGFCLAVCSFSEAAASDPYYLNGDKNYPMIQNTGGIYNDGTTGLFLDLSTVTIEDVFEDGLAARVKLMNLVSNKETGEAWVHVRFDVDGRVWAQRTDGKWSEVSKNFDDPAALAVMFVREEMGDDARRSVLTSQISKIMASKKEDVFAVEHFHIRVHEVKALLALRRDGFIFHPDRVLHIRFDRLSCNDVALHAKDTRQFSCKGNALRFSGHYDICVFRNPGS